MRNQWVDDHVLGPQAKMPFSFVYDGQASENLLPNWTRKTEIRKLDAGRAQHVFTWADPGTALEVRCVAVDYADYPAVEWTVYFKNAGQADTLILENIQGLAARFERGADGEFILHGIKGDFCAVDSYEPFQWMLAADTVAKLAPPASSGRSCNGPQGWPYHNLQFPGGGVILAVGWPGQWASSFTRDEARGLRIRAGQELTRLYLKPGEEIRTPLIALLFWQGADVVEAQNLWRRWYVEHNMPRVAGKTQPTTAFITAYGDEQDLALVQACLDAGIGLDFFWRDAGAGATTWYPSADGPHKGDAAWGNTGTWEIDSAKYPNGFKPLSDWLHTHGMQFMLWFEPERVGDPNSWLGRNHPEWLLEREEFRWGAVFDEGNPEALNWLIEHVDGLIKSQGIDWYREDMNIDPLDQWRRNDAPDRQGMTENLYVQGHLTFWDELRRRHPGLRIDSCASGGRRNDLETMRRAVPLLRSDLAVVHNMPGRVEGSQGHTYALSFWLPFQGTGCFHYEPYAYRSFYLPSFGMGELTAANTAAQQKAYGECRRVGPLMLADYYPLTTYSLLLDQWIAWQFNRPEQGDGVVQAFRRLNCSEAALALRLRGLDPDSTYEVTNFDVAGATRIPGKDLMEKGLTVEIKDKPGAAVILYKKANNQQ